MSNKKKNSSYIPGTIPTLNNWPAELRLPPKKKAEKPAKLEANPKLDPAESSLWDFSGLL